MSLVFEFASIAARMNRKPEPVKAAPETAADFSAFRSPGATKTFAREYLNHSNIDWAMYIVVN